MNITKRERIMVSAVIYLLVAFLFFYFIYIPRNNQINIAKSDVEKLEAALTEVEVMNEQKTKMQTEIDELEVETKEIQKRLPDDKNLLGVLLFIEEKANDSKIFMRSLSYKEEIKPDEAPLMDVNAIDLDLSFIGSYYGLLNFILQLQKAEQIMVLHNISLQAQQKKEIPSSTGIIGEHEPEYMYPTIEPPEPKGERVQTSETIQTQRVQLVTIKPKASARLDTNRYLLTLKMRTFYSGDDSPLKIIQENIEEGTVVDNSST